MTVESVETTRERLRERCRLYGRLTGECYLNWLAPRVHYTRRTLASFMRGAKPYNPRTIADAVEFEFEKIEKRNRKAE